MPNKEWEKVTYQFANVNSCAVEVWELISNCIPHIVIDVITYYCWDLSPAVFIKGAAGLSMHRHIVHPDTPRPRQHRQDPRASANAAKSPQPIYLDHCRLQYTTQ